MATKLIRIQVSAEGIIRKYAPSGSLSDGIFEMNRRLEENNTVKALADYDEGKILLKKEVAAAVYPIFHPDKVDGAVDEFASIHEILLPFESAVVLAITESIKKPKQPKKPKQSTSVKSKKSFFKRLFRC